MRQDHSIVAANSDVEILSNLIRNGRIASYELGPSRLTGTTGHGFRPHTSSEFDGGSGYFQIRSPEWKK